MGSKVLPVKDQLVDVVIVVAYAQEADPENDDDETKAYAQTEVYRFEAEGKNLGLIVEAVRKLSVHEN